MKQVKDLKRRLMSVLLIIALLVSVLAGCSGSSTDNTPKTLEKADSVAGGVQLKRSTTAAAAPEETTEAQDAGGNPLGSVPFKATMLDVGQGLSILVEADGHYLLFDGGPRERSSYVVSYLRQHGVTNLDYIVASHYDEDHIAGLVGVLNTAGVQNVLCPDYSKDTKIYQSFCNMLQRNGARIIHPQQGSAYALGGASVTVIHASNYAQEENDRSLAVKIKYGNNSIVITGDCESSAEYSMLYSGQDISANVLVAGHHGSSSSNSYSFVNKVHPSYVFISCGKYNSYGHPTQSALSNFGSVGAQIFRSDIQGEVTMYSDGNNVWFSTDPTGDWSPGAGGTDSSSGGSGSSGSYGAAGGAAAGAAASGSSSGSTSSGGYVLNTNSKKFHYPSCSAVSKMAEHNKQVSYASRDQLIAQGYSPCGICHP